MEGILTNPEYLTFWQGHDLINDGYIWSFPKVRSNTTNFGAKSGSWRDAFGWCTSLRHLYIKNLKGVIKSHTMISLMENKCVPTVLPAMEDYVF